MARPGSVTIACGQVVAARGVLLDRVLDATCSSMGAGLNRRAYGRFHAARMKTAWGSRCEQTFALVEHESILASAEQYALAGVFEGRAMRVYGIGSVWAAPSPQGPDHARNLIDVLIAD